MHMATSAAAACGHSASSASHPAGADAPAAALPGPASQPGRLKVAVIGDVHGAWGGAREEAALRLLSPDVTLLVGDFGNEHVALVRQIASLPLRKAVILGNHDAWHSLTSRAHGTARRPPVQQTAAAADLLAAARAAGGAAPGTAPGPAPAPAPSGGAGRGASGAVAEQLEALGAEHVGYGSMPLDEHGYSVLGARPFSKGGGSFTSIRPFMASLYGVGSMEESAERIVQAAAATPAAHALVVVGHNGPAGLGAAPYDMCGVDWEPRGGDHGDPDLQTALAAMHARGRHVALVVFGHMHHHLHPATAKGASGGRRLRRMAALDPATGTVYLNAATVPRVTSTAPPPPRSSPPLPLKSFGSGKRARVAARAAAAAAAATAAGGSTAAAAAAAQGAQPPTVHHYLFAELQDGHVVAARDVWVQCTPAAELGADAGLDEPAAATAVPGAAVVAERGSRDGGGAEASASASEDAETGPSVDGEGGGWAAAVGPRRFGEYEVQVVREHVVLKTVEGDAGGVVKFVWNAYDDRYESYVLGPDGGPLGRTASAGGEGRSAAATAVAEAVGEESNAQAGAAVAQRAAATAVIAAAAAARY